MIFISEFKVDLFQLKHTKDPEGLLNAIKQQHAAELGRKLIEQLPYMRVSGYEGELPAMSLNKDHEFTDRYETRFVVLTEETCAEAIRLLLTAGVPEEKVKPLFV